MKRVVAGKALCAIESLEYELEVATELFRIFYTYGLKIDPNKWNLSAFHLWTPEEHCQLGEDVHSFITVLDIINSKTNVAYDLCREVLNSLSEDDGDAAEAC
jgi:hypothetical protein